jgi:very-short-patch-repair endonuclease
MSLPLHHRYVPHLESPIEVALFDAMRDVALNTFDFDVLFFSDADRGVGIPVRIMPQEHVGPYRVDFLIRCTAGQNKFEIAVECDGHDYHERTKEQASLDKARDRSLQALGYRVYRFTGSDIHRDAKACANEIMASIAHWYAEQPRALNG